MGHQKQKLTQRLGRPADDRRDEIRPS